jgi:hypothetical protein
MLFGGFIYLDGNIHITPIALTGRSLGLVSPRDISRIWESLTSAIVYG